MKKKKIAVGLIGASGVGKTTIARAAAHRMRWDLLHTGDVIRGLLRANGITPSMAEIRKYADGLRKAGRAVLRLVLEVAFPDGTYPDRLIVDSFREEADIFALRQLSYDVHMVSIVTDDESRAAWLAQRRRIDDPETQDEQMAIDSWHAAIAGKKLEGLSIVNARDRLESAVAALCGLLERYA